MLDLTVSTNDRIFITGKTGSGKTYLMKFLTRQVKRLAVFDPKGSLDLDDWKLEPFSDKGVSKLKNGEEARLRVRYLPGEEIATYWLKMLEVFYHIGNVTIYIDEVYQVNGGPTTTPSPIVNTLYTLGRELGIGVWGVTQRPSWVPLVHMSESDHFFVFRLNMLDDRRRMAEVSGSNNILEPIRDPYGFFYMRPEWEEAEYIPKLSVKYVKTKPTKIYEQKEMAQ